MAVTVERADAREWSDEQMDDLFSDGFPPFITADKLAKQVAVKRQPGTRQRGQAGTVPAQAGTAE
ncbi:MAG: hypothetical protein JWM19_3736 [Actinomycetia bacterium]|nr:hypothetical protein [Actinomycetes bacterium]